MENMTYVPIQTAFRAMKADNQTEEIYQRATSPHERLKSN